MKKTWLFLVCVSYSVLALFAQNASDFKTELANGQLTITGYSGSATDVRIPDRINGALVTSIGERAFADTPLTSVTIPNSVTAIGDGAFASTDLTSVTIPNSVTAIGDGTFASCSSLTVITVDVRNSSFSSVEGVLFSRDMKTLVAYPGGKSSNYYTIPNSVTVIEAWAFAKTPLTSVTIPNSVTSIGDYAFYDTPLTSVTIPNSVTDIGERAFSSTRLTSVTIPNSVTSIGDYAFAWTLLRSVTIPNSVTAVGSWAFAQTRLTSVTIPNSVTSIGDHAFGACLSLTAITVDVRNSSFSSVDGVLFSRDMKTLVAYPGGKSSNYYTIPNSVTAIGGWAFWSMRLTSVTIPNSVTSIGEGAFAWSGLTSVTIPNSVTSIGELAFYKTRLTSVTIPNSVTSIGAGAFGETRLTSVTIPNSVTSIGDWAFDDDVEIIRADSGSRKSLSVSPVITVVNNTGYTFYYLYISPSDSDTWGMDVLGDQVLYDGQSFKYALPYNGTWDILAEDSDEDTYTRRLTVTADTTLSLTLRDLD